MPPCHLSLLDAHALTLTLLCNLVYDIDESAALNTDSKFPQKMSSAKAGIK